LYFRKVDVATYETIWIKKGVPPAALPFIIRLVQFVDSGALNILGTTDFPNLMGRKPVTLEEWARTHKDLWV